MKRTLSLVITLLLMLTLAPLASAQEELEVTASEKVTKLTFQVTEEEQLIVSALDGDDSPILNLTEADFTIKKGAKTAKILSVSPLKTNAEVGLNVVLVVDNSFSMKERKAVQPLLYALDEFLKTVRPIDNINAVVFDDKQTVQVGKQSVHAKTFQSNNPNQLRTFFENNLGKRLTTGTYLYDSILAGIDIARKLPAKKNKALIIFSDGKDINSSIKTKQLLSEAKGLTNFNVFAVDYMPQKKLDPFLSSFTQKNAGKSWKASSAKELLPIFKSFSTTLLHQYVVAFRFLNPPEGGVSFSSETLNIEEITTIDSSPLLSYVYFETGQSDIPSTYELIKDHSQRQSFSITALKDSMEKHANVLNIIGKRMTAYPEARLTLVGCNSNSGIEKGKKDLSRSRAESVKSYLKYIWGVDSGRIQVQARNLPKHASTSRLAEGKAENQRVEIQSDYPQLLDTVKTTYLENAFEAKTLTVIPQIKAEAGVATWALKLMNDEKTIIAAKKGVDTLPLEIEIDLGGMDVTQVVQSKQITAMLEVTDKEGKIYSNQEAGTLPVNFIKKEQRAALKQGERILEKYALILFDFNSSEVKNQNKKIVTRIMGRLRELPQAFVKITGHTDTIGNEDYNIKLSEKRAVSVHKEISTSLGPGRHIEFQGAGPYAPLYSNQRPEGRALNRTVTITIEYQK